MNIINEALRTWRHAGFQCAIRQHLGYLCGYVQIPEGHPWHGDRDLWLDGDLELTWSWPDESGEWWVGVDWCPTLRQMIAAGLSAKPMDILASTAEYARRHGPSEQDAVSAVIGLANRAREVADG